MSEDSSVEGTIIEDHARHARELRSLYIHHLGGRIVAAVCGGVGRATSSWTNKAPAVPRWRYRGRAVYLDGPETTHAH